MSSPKSVIISIFFTILVIPISLAVVGILFKNQAVFDASAFVKEYVIFLGATLSGFLVSSYQYYLNNKNRSLQVKKVREYTNDTFNNLHNELSRIITGHTSSINKSNAFHVKNISIIKKSLSDNLNDIMRIESLYLSHDLFPPGPLILVLTIKSTIKCIINNKYSNLTELLNDINGIIFAIEEYMQNETQNS